MALRIVDAQMMIAKPAELAGSQAHAQRHGGVNLNMAREVDSDTQKDMNRTQAALPADGARVNPDADGGGGGGYYGQAPDQPQQEEIPGQLELKDIIAKKMLSLPVDKGKYAKGEEHKIDILV